jgi:integrase
VANGPIPYHESILLPEGRKSFSTWLEYRRTAGIAGTVLFPSDDLGEPMHQASIYRRVRRVIEEALESAGLTLPESRLSPQTLRNTYAGLLIDMGCTDREIMECMGIKALRSMGRIRTYYEMAKNHPN